MNKEHNDYKRFDLSADEFKQRSDLSKNTLDTRQNVTRSLFNVYADRSEQSRMQLDNIQKHNKSNVTVSAFKIDDYSKNQTTLAQTSFNQSNLDKIMHQKPHYNVHTTQQSIEITAPQTVSSRELLSEPNLYNSGQSPNDVRKSHIEELEYRTILNRAEKALESGHYQHESQDFNIYTVQKHQESVENALKRVDESRKKSIRSTGVSSSLVGRNASHNSSISNERSLKNTQKRSCCSIDSSDSVSDKKNKTKKRLTSKKKPDDRQYYNYSKSIKSVRCLGAHPLPNVPRSTSRGKTPKTPLVQTKPQIAQSSQSVLFKILNDIVLKYKTATQEQSSGNIKLRTEKKQMLKELSILAEALMDQENSIQREREQQKKKVTALKQTIQDQELELLNSEAQLSKVSKLNAQLLKESEDLHRQLNEQENKIKKRTQHYESQKDLMNQEKKLVQIKLEEDKMKTLENHQNHYEMKLQALQAINDQLGQKLQSQHENHQQVLYERQTDHNEQIGELTRNCQMWQTKAQNLEKDIEDLRQEMNFKTSTDLLKLQMQIKVKDQHITSLKCEISGLNQKLNQKFEILDSQTATATIESEVLAQQLESKIKQVKQSLQDKETELAESVDRFEKKLIRKTKQHEQEVQELKLLVQNLQKELQGSKSEILTSQELHQQTIQQLKAQHKKELQSHSDCTVNNQLLQTKEEEIQLLMNVVKQVNKCRGSPVNISQLESMLCGKENIPTQQYQQNQKLFQQRSVNY